MGKNEQGLPDQSALELFDKEALKQRNQLIRSLVWTNRVLIALLVLGVIAFIAYIFLDRLLQKPLVVEDGKLVGEYRQTAYRSNAELAGAAMHFLECYLSYNSATAYQDYACAITMMDKPLAEMTIKRWQDTDYIKKVVGSRSQSHLVFNDKRAVEFIDVTATNAKVRVRGDLNVKVEGSDWVTTPFDTIIDLKVVSVSKENTYGVKITGVTDK
jgi:hypothetical protein